MKREKRGTNFNDCSCFCYKQEIPAAFVIGRQYFLGRQLYFVEGGCDVTENKGTWRLQGNVSEGCLFYGLR